MDDWCFDREELTKVVSMSKRSQRDPSRRMAPFAVEVDFTDAKGRSDKLIGGTLASAWMKN